MRTRPTLDTQSAHRPTACRAVRGITRQSEETCGVPSVSRNRLHVNVRAHPVRLLFPRSHHKAGQSSRKAPRGTCLCRPSCPPDDRCQTRHLYHPVVTDTRARYSRRRGEPRSAHALGLSVLSVLSDTRVVFRDVQPRPDLVACRWLAVGGYGVSRRARRARGTRRHSVGIVTRDLAGYTPPARVL